MLLSCVLSGVALSQTPSEMPPVFDAAEVKSNKPGTTEGGGYISAGRADFRGVTLLKLITKAYSINRDKVIGGPNWLDTDRFDMSRPQ
jgi:uncharacterized protein (TIGR03435 family)